MKCNKTSENESTGLLPISCVLCKTTLAFPMVEIHHPCVKHAEVRVSS